MANAAPAANEAPTASIVAPLTFVNVSANNIHCLFHAECDPTVDNATALFAYDGMEGAGYLQARTWSRGQTGSAGAGLYPSAAAFSLVWPLGDQEVTAVFDEWLEVLTRAPEFNSDPTLQVFPSDGLAGENE